MIPIRKGKQLDYMREAGRVAGWKHEGDDDLIGAQIEAPAIGVDQLPDRHRPGAGSVRDEFDLRVDRFHIIRSMAACAFPTSPARR